MSLFPSVFNVTFFVMAKEGSVFVALLFLTCNKHHFSGTSLGSSSSLQVNATLKVGFLNLPFKKSSILDCFLGVPSPDEERMFKSSIVRGSLICQTPFHRMSIKY